MSAAVGELTNLMRQMGSKDGFDPMPPSQHAYLLDIGESATDRAIAWMWSKTIHPGKGRKRSPFARDERGPLTLKHAAADLGWEMSNASAAFAKLSNQGRIRKDAKGHFYLEGDVPAPRRTNGESKTDAQEDETQAQPICTYKLPRAFALYLEQLPKNESVQRAHDYQRLQEYRKKLEADAIAAARATGQELELEYFRVIGFEHRTLRGRPKIERDNWAVQLSLTSLPDLSVQITQAVNSVQNGNGLLYKSQNGSAHITPSLLNTESSENRVSEQLSPHSRQPSPPPTPPTQQTKTKNLSDESNELLRTIEGLLNHRLNQDPLKAKFLELGPSHGISHAAVAEFLLDKRDEKKSARYPIHNLGALYRFAVQDLPAWIEGRQANTKQFSAPPDEPEPERTVDEKIRKLKDCIDDNPDSPAVPRLRKQIKDLTRGAIGGQQ